MICFICRSSTLELWSDPARISIRLSWRSKSRVKSEKELVWIVFSIFVCDFRAVYFFTQIQIIPWLKVLILFCWVFTPRKLSIPFSVRNFPQVPQVLVRIRIFSFFFQLILEVKVQNGKSRIKGRESWRGNYLSSKVLNITFNGI